MTMTVADPFIAGTATAMTRTGADAIVVSCTTVSPAATAACAAASSVIGPSATAPEMTPVPVAPAGTRPPGPGARTIPMVPEASPPMTRPGWLGSDVTPTTCVAPSGTGPNACAGELVDPCLELRGSARCQARRGRHVDGDPEDDQHDQRAPRAPGDEAPAGAPEDGRLGRRGHAATR